MEIGILKTPTKHIYKEINEGKFITTRHYIVDEVVRGNLLLTESLKISNNRGFAKSDPDKWLHIKPLKRWISLTGLFYNKEFDIFIGDKGQNNKKEELIIVQFSDTLGTLKVYYFKGYYTNEIKKVIHFIDQEPI